MSRAILASTPVPETRILLRWTALVAVSAALAYGLSRAHFPAALLIGPMLAAITFGVRGAGLSLPRPLFLGAQAVIGCLVAHSATTEIAATLREDGLIIFAVVGVTVVAGALTGLALTRLRVLPGTTAAWGSSPGERPPWWRWPRITAPTRASWRSCNMCASPRWCSRPRSPRGSSPT
ncbi:hypothetical protein GCM10025880_02850 [Methylorubrum aminovorans]|nr:hypothetical protein GCM10025880_02850 [Methylorubrum aminovorans]